MSLPLFEPTVLGSGITPLFTATSNTRIDKVTISNPLGTPCTVALFIVAAGTVPTQGNQILPPFNIAAGQSWDARQVAGHILGAGDSLQGLAGAPGQMTVFGAGTVVS